VKRLTIDNFLKRLEKRSGMSWYITIDGYIRTDKPYCCPITAVHADRGNAGLPQEYGKKLGLSKVAITLIMRASDKHRMGVQGRAKLRRRILLAVGLKKK